LVLIEHQKSQGKKERKKPKTLVEIPKLLKKDIYSAGKSGWQNSGVGRLLRQAERDWTRLADSTFRREEKKVLPSGRSKDAFFLHT
jgi:hypothetical protein